MFCLFYAILYVHMYIYIARWSLGWCSEIKFVALVVENSLEAWFAIQELCKELFEALAAQRWQVLRWPPQS